MTNNHKPTAAEHLHVPAGTLLLFTASRQTLVQLSQYRLSQSCFPETYREDLPLVSLILGREGPPAFDPLVLEQRHLRHGSVRLQHVQRAQLRRLGAAGETVQVQCQ